MNIKTLICGLLVFTAIAQSLAGPPAQRAEDSRIALELVDYAALPVTGQPDGENTRGLLARVNYLRDEPGGRRFFVNDLNGPLYILDKKTRQFTIYLDFNGLDGRPGLFPKFTFEKNFATGLTNFVFDPDYARNGTFYTLHMEDPATPGDAKPKSSTNPRIDISKYETTAAIPTPTIDDRIARHVVLIEWKDRDTSNSTFEGSARELLRLEHPLPQHPLGEMTFNPGARRGDPDWRVMYLGAGDSGSGDQSDSRRMNPQRLDTLVGKILRIVPDINAHLATSTVSANGRYRIPNDNPFMDITGARPEIWAYGIRNPHRLIWDPQPKGSRTPRLLAFNIGLVTWESVVIIDRGANYGWPLREGTEVMSPNGPQPVPEHDVIPVHVSDTVMRGSVTPRYPVLQYPHRPSGGDAIGNGFIYRGKAAPMLRDRLIFGDITTGRMWSAAGADVRHANDGDPRTLAAFEEVEPGLRTLVERSYKARGGRGATLPGRAMIAGVGRVDLRFAEDEEGELFLLTKADGMIRKVATARSVESAKPAPDTSAASSDPRVSSSMPQENPMRATSDSLASGKRAYNTFCASCHGDRAQGAVRAGIAVSIIQESGGRQPSDLTDDVWDHGSTDAAVFRSIKKGVPSSMMPAWEGAIPDEGIWNLVNYVRSLKTSGTAP